MSRSVVCGFFDAVRRVCASFVPVQGKKLSFHSTCPLDEYFSDFGRPNVKCTRPKYVMIKDRLTKTYKFATSFSFNR